MTGGFLAIHPADIAAAAPEIVLALVGCFILLLEAFAPSARRWFATFALLAVAAATQPFGVAFGGGLVSDAAAAFSKVAIYVASAVAVPLGQYWFERRGVKTFEFPVLILLATLYMGVQPNIVFNLTQASVDQLVQVYQAAIGG